MRFTTQIRPLLVGLSILISHLMLTATPVAGWEWNPFGAPDQPQPPVATGRANAPANGSANRNAAIAPTSPRWSEGGVQQAHAQGVPKTGGVQQTAHTGPSRNGTLFGDGASGPSWRGQKVQVNTKMFSRPSANRPATASPPTASGRPAAAPTTRTAMSGRVPSTGRTASGSPAPTQLRNAANQQTATKPTATSTAAKLTPTPEPTLAEPVRASSVATTVEPKTPADRLVMQAHSLSSRASTEEDFTKLIETCRRARASQLSPELNSFTNELMAWSLNRRGQLKAEAGYTQEALLDFEDAIRSNPQLWRAIHNRGVLRAQAGEFEAAFDDFNRTIECNPDFAKAYSNRAALFVVANDHAAALNDYTRAVELDPNLAVAHRGRARVCHLLGRLDESLDNFDAAVQLDPNDAFAVACRADLLTDIGRYADAAKGYERAIELDPKLAAAYRGSAWLLSTAPDSSVRNPSLALDRAEQAIQLEGREEAISLDTLAAALASAGDFSAAMEMLVQAIEIAPDDERTAYQDRMRLYQRAKPYRIAPVRGVAQVSYEGKSY